MKLKATQKTPSSHVLLSLIPLRSNRITHHSLIMCYNFLTNAVNNTFYFEFLIKGGNETDHESLTDK